MPDTTLSARTDSTVRARLRTIREVSRLAARNAFIPINAIIFAVVALLVVFGEVREGLFLGAIVFLNIILGFGQDLRAWLLLEKLQIATALKVLRLNADGSESHITPEEIVQGDRIKLALGDQAPCDGTLLESKNLEVNEGLITGESELFPRGKGENVLAGSVVVAGSGILQVATAFTQSRMARMAHGLKRYIANPSPIQLSVGVIIRYTVYTLLVVVAFIAVRGALTGETEVQIVEQIGALASVLVPQGLVVAVTLLFTYGAGHFYNRHVLLQEVNATEKFGRIKNLCMDKTGTLTENELAAERFDVPPHGDEDKARELAALYTQYSGDSSQVVRTISAFVGKPTAPAVREALPFSSWQRYGGIVLADEDTVVLMGGSEVFTDYVHDDNERAWLTRHSTTAAHEGKHVLCLATMHGTQVPHELSNDKLSIAGLFILGNKLRTGVQDSVNFFQDRGITIRILSGDHPDTVRTIATAAGIKNTQALITGAEMTDWDEADYMRNVQNYALFARIEPEQKEKIIDALKADGFTAMIGDGANDALSVKKADLGIALSDGASATRQIAAVVLMHNSFVELPRGVRLADSIIENIEIYAGIWLNQTFVQFLFFVALAAAGLAFPLTPLNVTFMNYFTVGFLAILISFWAIRPSERTAPASMRPFLKRVTPFPAVLSFIQAFAIVVLFFFVRPYLSGTALSAILVIGIVATGLAFFVLAAEHASGGLRRAQRLLMYIFIVVEAAMLYAAFEIPFVRMFFDLNMPSRSDVILALLVSAGCTALLWLAARIFFAKRRAIA